MIRGSVDNVTSSEVTGWAFSAGRRDGLTVQAILNHELLGEVAANVHRSDLAAAGLGEGNCGFTITLLRPIEARYLPFIVVKPEGGDVELPRSTLSGFSEYFTGIYASYPVVGRHRTVLGGLWTDASSILSGKQALDLIQQPEADRLSRLIHEGYCTLDVGVRTPDQSPASIEALIERPVLLDLLHSAFEDRVVVIKSDVVEGDCLALTQPSLQGTSSSPAECLTIIVPLGYRDVAIDVVRASHQFPEFTRDGRSRWAQRDEIRLNDVVPLEHAQVDRVTLSEGMAALLGAGTIYRLNSLQNRKALRLTCVPGRAMPATYLEQDSVREIVIGNGARIIVSDAA